MDSLDSHTLALEIEGSNLAGASLLADNMVIGTVSCGIRLPNSDGRILLLTTVYAFEKEIDDNESSVEDTTDPLTPNSDEEDDGKTFTIGDVIYDLSEMENRDETEIVRHVYSDTTTNELIKLHGIWAIAHDSKLTNFGLALVETEESKQWEPSAICETIPWETIFECREDRNVHILTSHGSIESIIIPIPAFTCDENWNSIAFWDVVVDDHDEKMHMGDVGAVVIDTLTGKIFGYAIEITISQDGRSALRVNPLQPVVSQLSEIFKTNVEVFLNVTAPSLSKVVGKDRELPADFRRLWPVEKQDR
ncbi:hypothetical protein THAR02_10411 [Trichoderma harzianum]|uniref:Uncharacterized protein n=1 Tax=Trichoderma harzianum TaxID=5544 RepID=A0A0F9X9N3_TRIHA|nr:hypothetical protein THAR02_10411 [Trichoderma harzianum]